MLGRKCSLCGGKLDGRNVCKECGLDNTKSDKYYKINQSSCDDMPLTHVHEEHSKQAEKPQKREKPQRNHKNHKSQKRGNTGAVVGVLVVVLGLISSGISIFENLADTSYETVEVSYDPYEYLKWGHPEEGEFISYTLTSGDYIVGVHLAEGDYQAIVNADFDTVQVSDYENGIYLYEYSAKEDNYLNDLRLFYGAKVTIVTETEIVLDSYNAQPQIMNTMIANPVTDSYELKKDYEAKAGTDFAAGIYDIHTDAENVYITLTIVEEDGTEWNYYENWEIGSETDVGNTFCNLVLPEGAKILCQEADVELVPSEEIGDYDYSEYYQ